MNEITLNRTDIIETASHSSKGNQPKWFKNGIWYKADCMGYEGLSEIMVSSLLKYTNSRPFLEYHPIKINCEGKIANGCYSYNFLQKNCELVPLERLYRAYNGKELSQELKKFETVEEKIKYTVDFVIKTTGLTNFGEWLTELLEIDALFLNEDRHTNNIAFIKNRNNDKFEYVPYFDFGLSLLSDLDGFWLEGNTDNHLKRVHGKPFADFSKQVEAARALYGSQLEINFTMDEVNNVLKQFEDRYNDEIIKRVRYILERQLNIL